MVVTPLHAKVVQKVTSDRWGKSSSPCFKGTGCCHQGQLLFFTQVLSACHQAWRKICERSQLEQFQNMKNDVLHRGQGRAQCKEMNSTDSIKSRTFAPLVPLQDKLFPVLMLDINSSWKCSVTEKLQYANKVQHFPCVVRARKNVWLWGELHCMRSSANTHNVMRHWWEQPVALTLGADVQRQGWAHLRGPGSFQIFF